MLAITFIDNWESVDISNHPAGVANAKLDRDLAFQIHTSQLIGRQLDLVIHIGGNTSCKTKTTNPYGNRIDFLCGTGSGWNLGTTEPTALLSVVPITKLYRTRSNLIKNDIASAIGK